MYCPVGELESIPVPAVSELANTSTSLAETLMNADVNAPMRCIKVKNALTDIRSQIIHSDIDVTVREKLAEQIHELQQLVQVGADHLTIMLASFGGTMDRLRIYAQFALEDLSKVIKPEVHTNNDRLQIGYSKMEVKNMLTESFESYLASLIQQIDKILFKAQDAHTSLESIKNKFETIQELNFKGKFIAEKRLDQLKYAPFWSWLFDEGKFGIAKNERSLKILDGFINFVTAASDNVNDIIIKLKMFKHDAEDLKETGISLENLPRISINRQAQLLQAAIKRLAQSKEKFEGKKQQINEEDEIQ